MGKTKVEGKDVKLEPRKSPGDPALPDDPNRPSTKPLAHAGPGSSESKGGSAVSAEEGH